MQRIIGAILVLGLLLSQLLVLQRCANPVPPTGGLKDSIGPVLVLDETTPAFQRNFKPQRIELTFDEWVKIKDPTQLIVSPPLEPAPKMSLKKRTLIIDFGEAELRDSATYVINVGEAVVDLTEGNPPDNLRFVFATGPVLDSASVSGTLVDAYTQEPVEGAMLALYANLADTAALTENPFYFAKTNEEGEYDISNIRPGSYQVVALDNGGLGGYKYDERATQKVGFLDSTLVVPDGKSLLRPIKVFPLPKRLRVLKKDTTDYGQLKIAFDRPAERVNLLSQGTYERVNDGDTLRLFYTESSLDTLLFSVDTSYLDTFIIPQPIEPKSWQPLKLAKKIEKNLSPFDPLSLLFSRPLATVDSTAISLLLDTLPATLKFKSNIDSTQRARWILKYDWTEKGKYGFTALPNTFTDILGQENPDTIRAEFTVQEKKRYGTLNLKISGLDSTQAYVVRLVKGTDRAMERQFIVDAGSSSFTRTINGLSPATFQLELVTDWNRNGRYDAGDFLSRRPSEPVQTFEIEALRANWELEAAIDVRQ